MAVRIIYPTLRQNNTPRKNLLPSMEILDKYILFDDLVLSRQIGTLLQKFLVYYKYQEKACVYQERSCDKRCVSGI